MESIYKIDTGSDHVAKFRGDRPRELGDLAAKKTKKHHEHFISPPVTTVHGRPNYGHTDLADETESLLYMNFSQWGDVSPFWNKSGGGIPPTSTPLYP